MLKYIDKTVTAIVSVILIFSLCMVDAETWTPTIVFILSCAYMTWTAWRKGWIYRG